MTKIGYNYAFDETACASCGGQCCVGERGVIWVNAEEISALAKLFNLDYDIFCEKYAKKIDGRVSLREKPYKDGWACIFYEEGCTVYAARPAQCATFPFWEKFLQEPQYLSCPGVSFR